MVFFIILSGPNQVIIRRQESNLLMFFRPRYRNSSNKQIRATNNFFFFFKEIHFYISFFYPASRTPSTYSKRESFFFNAFIYLGTPFESHLCSKIWRKNCSRKNQKYLIWIPLFLFSLIQETVDRLQQEEDARNQLFQQKKKLEQENGGLKKDIEDLELAIQKVR